MNNGNGELMFRKDELNFITLYDELRAYTLLRKIVLFENENQ